MNTCIYSKEKFGNASSEHILQNFLGARWTSNTIATNAVQEKFGKTIDVALEQGLQSIRNLFGTKGGRGAIGPSLKNIESSQGGKYHVEPGGKPKLAEPFIKSTPLESGGHEVQVKLGSMNQLEWAIAKIKQQFPDATIDFEKIKENLVTEKAYLDEKIIYKLGIGGKDYFRGLLKSIFNLLGVMNTPLALSPEFDDLRKFILEGDAEPSKYIRWLNTDEQINIPRLSDFDHFIAVFTKNKCVEGIAQFYGDIPHLIRLSDGYKGVDFSYSYLVNPFRSTKPAEIRNPPNFEKDLLPGFDNHAEIPNEDVWGPYKTRFSRILKRYYDKADKERIGEIVDEVLIPRTGELFTPELIDELTKEIMKYITHRIMPKK